MTTTLDRAPANESANVFPPTRFRDAVRSEWTKTRSVPSTMWTLISAAVLGIGIGALATGLQAHAYLKSTAADKATWDPTSASLAGLALAQLAIGVLGVLVITSEYSTGSITSTLAAVPKRARLLAAKGAVVVGMTFVAVEIMAFVAFFIGQGLISGHAPTAGIGQAGVLRALVGTGLYGGLVVLLGFAFGAILRSAAGAITSLVAVLFVLPGIAAALPNSIQNAVEKYWPTQAGGQITAVVRGSDVLSPWAGLGVLAVFVAAVLAIALHLLNRRDA
jgi:hypothetical protein